jgi:hypothetical protein
MYSYTTKDLPYTQEPESFEVFHQLLTVYLVMEFMKIDLPSHSIGGILSIRNKKMESMIKDI